MDGFFVPLFTLVIMLALSINHLLVMVIAFSMLSKYTCFTIMQGGKTYASHKNLCAQISLELHQKVSEAREESGLTTAQYITQLLTEYRNERKWR